jgi:hypothetical protein
MDITSARNAPRSTALARWGWSGVEMLCIPPLADEKLAQIIKLLPRQLLASEEIKNKIVTLGAQYHRYLHQDEIWPDTRGANGGAAYGSVSA